jgi:hypothetical protein
MWIAPPRIAYSSIAGSDRMQSVCVSACEERAPRDGARRLQDDTRMGNISREARIDGGE